MLPPTPETNADARAVAMLHNQAVAEFRAGRLPAARTHLVRATRLVGSAAVDVRVLKSLWQCCLHLQDWTTALAAGVAASRRDPLDFALADRLLKALHACPVSLLAPGPPALPAQPRPTLAVVIVSRDDARFAGAAREFGAALGAWPHEIIRAKGAASMYEGYAHGLQRTRADVVVFAHDDVGIAISDFAVRLHASIADADLVGVAGTTRVSGPSLACSGHPWLHGAIAHPAPVNGGFEFALWSFAGPHIDSAQGLDGVFLCVRRALAHAVGFDPARFDGFHFYDLDFSYRAWRDGLRVRIAADLGLIHASRGRVDARYHAAAAAFAAKFPDLDAPAATAAHWYTVSVPTRAAVAQMHAKLAAAWALDVDRVPE